MEKWLKIVMTVCLPFASVQAFWAQASSEITILSEADNDVVPNAHLLFTLQGEDKQKLVLTNYNGVAIIEGEEGANAQLEISFLGFKTIHKTISIGTAYTFKLVEETQTLNSLVVTGQYSENSPEKAVQRVTIISQEKIEKMAAVSLKDVLSNELNVRLSQDNVLGSGMSLQGISGENVKILIDGVPMIGRLDGNIDLSQINMNDVERIEIIQGPMSVNYGTNALAGVINIITKKGNSKKLEASASSFSESVGNYNIDGRVSVSWKKHQMVLSGGRNYFDGWIDGDRLFLEGERIADSTRYKTWNPKEQWFGKLSYQHELKDGYVRYTLGGFHELISNRGLPKAPYGEAAFDDYYLTQRIDNSIAVSKKWDDHNFNVLTAYNDYRRVKNTYFKDLTTLNQVLTENNGDQDTSSFKQFMLRSFIASANDSVSLNYQVGIDLNLESAYGARIDDQQQQMADFALFGSLEYKPFENTIIRPGIRYGYNTIYKAPITPSINIKQGFGKFNARASYARGFRAPSLKELYFEFVDVNHNIVGNLNLNAEYSHNSNLSINYTTSKENNLFKAELVGFYNKIYNMITLVQTDVNAGAYSYANIDEFQTQGMQLNLSDSYKHIKGALGLSYTGRYNILYGSATGVSKFSYTPEVRANVNYEFPKLKLYVASFYKYTGRLPSFQLADGEEEALQRFIEPYHMADVSVGRKFWNNRLNVVVGSKNIFNIKNVNATSASSSAHGGSSGMSIVGMGRTYFVQLKLNLSHAIK
jgi:outer membrane receptor for ferrienterochelin and colicins